MTSPVVGDPPLHTGERADLQSLGVADNGIMEHVSLEELVALSLE